MTEAETDMNALVRSCVFCGRISRKEFDRAYGHDSAGSVVFEPLDPVTPGHLLVVPMSHVIDATHSLYVTSEVMRAAAMEAKRMKCDANIITSIGAAATQTVFHMHVHVVPRQADDGLHLPWTGQKRQSAR